MAGMDKVAKDLLKSVAIDCNLHKYKPSILAAVLVFAAYQI